MTISDLRIPRTSDILDRAADERERADRLNDKLAFDQFGRLIERLIGARLCWQLGTLHIDSTSGGRYTVTRAGCSCPNGQRCGKRACWHVALFELLLDMLDTEAQTTDDEALIEAAALLIDQLDVLQGDSDFESDCDEPAAPAWRIGQVIQRQLVWGVL